MEGTTTQVDHRRRFESTSSTDSNPTLAERRNFVNSAQFGPPGEDMLVHAGGRKRSVACSDVFTLGPSGTAINLEKLCDVLAKLMFAVGPLLSAALLIIGLLVLTGLLVLSAKAIATITITTAAVLLVMSIYLAVRHLAPPPTINLDVEEEIPTETRSEHSASKPCQDDTGDPMCADAQE